jgi:AcrR family transcriptional regulator
MVAGKRLPSPQRREQILDATRRIVVSEGYHAASIERVAAACEITRTVIYQQFGGLAGLLVALIDREVDRAHQGFRRAVAQPAADGDDPFTTAVGGIFDAVDAAPDTWRMLLLPVEGGPPELHERLARARAVVRSYLRNITGDDEDPDLSVRILHAASDELVRLHLTDPSAYPTERLLAQARRVAQAIIRVDSPGRG